MNNRLKSPKPSIRANDDGTEIQLRVQPKASRNAFIQESDWRIRACITAPPVDGKANKALIAFLAKSLQIPKRQVRLIRGETSREKTLHIEDLDVNAVCSLLKLYDEPTEGDSKP